MTPATWLLVLLSLAIVGLVACSQHGEPPVTKAMIAHGKYLVTAMGCGDCHSPRDSHGRVIPGKEFSGHPADAPLPSWEPALLSQHTQAPIGSTRTAFAGRFGISFAANLTPDLETGIGRLTPLALMQSWRTGRHWQEDRQGLPPMPVDVFKHLSDADVRAIHAYLMALAPVRNEVPKAHVVVE